jgi:LAS superfamily LD-carboxypeptidase LdcB
MKKLLFAALLLLAGCGQHQSGQNKNPEPKHRHSRPAAQLSITNDFVTGQFDFTERKDFVKVAPKYANKAVYLQKKTYQAFKAMADSAKKDGIRLIIVSGTRNFAYQKGIWDRKWKASDASTGLAKAKGILEYSSMPMTSRHHWGTDMDLNNLNNSYFESGKGKKEYEWLKNHANKFGFYQPYTDKSINGRTGYNEEKWHWSYLPLACRYLTYYNKHITNKDITGFKGSRYAQEIDMVKNYVNGISQKMKKACKAYLSRSSSDNISSK